MKSRKLKSLFTVWLFALAAPLAEGATLNIQQDVDLTSTTILAGPPNQFFRFFDEATPMTIHNGDSVNLTFNFLKGRLMMADLAANPDTYESAFPWLGLVGSSGGRYGISDIKISFLDAVATGGAQSQFAFASESSGNVALGPSLVEFLPSGSSLTFSGIKTSFNVDFIFGGKGVYKPWLVFTADQLAVTPIPEPSTYAFGALLSLLIGGRVLRRTR